MKITVIRDVFDDTSTEGKLYVNDVFECFTLEPPDKPNIDPIAPKGCIPCGTYPVTITFSGHFQRDMPLVENVPNFEQIRIHPGNWPSNTEGCCLVGVSRGKDYLGQSVAAFDPLFDKIKNAIDSGEQVTIEYRKE